MLNLFPNRLTIPKLDENENVPLEGREWELHWVSHWRLVHLDKECNRRTPRNGHGLMYT
jgi:hypothetical protein